MQLKELIYVAPYSRPVPYAVTFPIAITFSRIHMKMILSELFSLWPSVMITFYTSL